MQKKFLVFTFLLLALLFIHSFVFADNANLGDELKDTMNKAGNAVQNVTNAVTGTASDMMNGNDNNNGNTTGRATTDNMNNDNTTRRTGTDNMNNGYTTVRTANTGAFGMSETTWIWLILGIVALSIILLSWYYMSDANKTSRNHD